MSTPGTGKRRGAQARADDPDDDLVQASAGHKRGRQSSNQFKKGTVVKLRAHDFMTYAGTVTIQPGPRLNVVLGPNGTGKSSFVSALCVGLAGSTKLLGRADNLGQFVRHNCNSAWVEVTLSGGDNNPDYVVYREIRLARRTDEAGGRAEPYESSFKINGHPRKMTEVQELVKELNIQFDNLCQFLPQDKVSEFSSLNSCELLVATEKALGDSRLHELHQELITQQATVTTLKAEHERMAKNLQRLKAEHEGQRREYERFGRRKELQQQASLASHKALALELEDAVKLSKAALRELKLADKHLKELEAETQQEMAPVVQLEATQRKVQHQLDAGKLGTAQQRRQLDRLTREMDGAKQSLDDALRQLSELDAKSKRHAENLLAHRAAVNDAEAQLRTMPKDVTEDLRQRQEQFRAEHAQAKEASEAIDYQVMENQQQQADVQKAISDVTGQLSQLNNLKQQRIRRCIAQGHKFNGLQEVLTFIDTCRREGRFQGPVFGPVAVEIDVYSNAGPQMQALWAGFLEQQCWNAASHFVVSCRADDELLSGFLKSKRLTFTVAAVNKKETDPISHPDGDASALGQFHIQHTLDQLFDAPPLVKHMLCDLAAVNRAYVGTAAAEQAQDALFQATRVSTVYCTPSTMLRRTGSRFNAATKYVETKSVQGSRLLAGPSSAGVEEEKHQRLQEKAALQARLQELERKLAGFEAEKHGQVSIMDRCSKGHAEIEAKRNALHQRFAKQQTEVRRLQHALACEQRRPDPKAQEGELRQQQGKLLDNLLRLALQQTQVCETLWTGQQAVTLLELQQKELDMQITALKALRASREAARRAALQERDKAQRVLDGTKADEEAARQAVLRAPPLTPVEQRLLATLPGSRAELEEWKNQKLAEADAIVCNDAGVVQAFERRQKEIDDKEAEFTSKADTLAALEQRRDQVKEEWLPPLQQLVQQINGTFSELFKHVACAGEVFLHEDGVLYSKYAIEIRVKFREEEQLQLLTDQRQSGGERSVSTILYLISLQAVTSTPFRVVDEINQGMDPINERKVFILLVESSCKPDTPQCFLLTPKLLQGLPFTEDITVLTIMNGPYIDAAVVGQEHAFTGPRAFGARWAQLAAAQQAVPGAMAWA